MTKNQILGIDYQAYKNQKIGTRFFPFSLISDLILNEEQHLNWKTIGHSFEDRPIRMLKLGDGNKKILLWSQMHGNEPTATGAIFDLINYLNSKDGKLLLNKLTIYLIPVINPDGLERNTRRNAQQIDINRDFLSLQSPEAKVLKGIFEEIKPDFAFNLHDQSSLYATSAQKAVAISLLAPPADANLRNTWSRTEAMKLIAGINHSLQKIVPQQVARFKDEYEPRAFGDNFQKYCPTVLIESGFLPHDPERQYIRELNFYAILTALYSIAQQDYQEVDLINYAMIPFQSQEMLHVKIENCAIIIDGQSYRVDLGLNYTEIFDSATRTVSKLYCLTDIGDLNTQKAYETLDASDLLWIGELTLNQPACLELRDRHAKVVCEWKSGIRI